LPNLCSAIRATLGQRQIRQSPGLPLNAHSGNEWGKIPVLTGISVTASRLWNDLPPELRTFSLPPLSSLQIIKHHLYHAPPAVCHPRAFHSKLKSHLFKLSFSDSPDSISSHSSPKLHVPALTPNLPSLTFWQPDLSFPRTILWKPLCFDAFSHPLATGPEPPTDYWKPL